MNRRSITGTGLVFVLAGCSSSATIPTGAGGSTGSSASGSTSTDADASGSTGGASENVDADASGSTGDASERTDAGASGSTDGGASGSTDDGASGDTDAGASGSADAGASGNAGMSAGGAAGGSGADDTAGMGMGGGSIQPTSAMVTSASGAYWQIGTFAETTSGTADVTVDDGSILQSWEGMGGAFNELGWSYLTTKELQDQAIQLLFGSDGCRFAWGRIPIGASDYAMDRYTDDEVSSGSDTALLGFSIDRDEQKLIPYIKAAQAVNPGLRFWASPWTPPTWMKKAPYQSGNSVNAFDGGTMKSDDATLTADAQYFVKFVQAYQAEDIRIEFVSPQNEPNYSQNYPSSLWSPTTFTTFIGKYLGPALSRASSPAQVMLGTLSNDASSADVAVANAVLADPTAKSYCKVMGVQWGMSDADQIANLTSSGAGIPIWITEHQCGNYPSGGASTTQAPNDHAYGVESWGYIRDAIKHGVTAYNAWNMVLDPAGKGIDNTRQWAQNALLVADSGQLTPTPAYYVFRHISQFVDPGARVVATSGSSEAVAFKNSDGTLVAVMYNSGEAKTYSVSIAGKLLQFHMPESGWATLKITRRP